MTDSTSPLSEVKPDSLEDLFSLDPRKLEDKDVQRIRSALRSQREKWEAQENAAKASPKPKAQAAPANLDLSMLGLLEKKL